MSVQRTVLIIADFFDTHADAVECALTAKHQRTFRLNLDKNALLKTHLSLTEKKVTICTEQGVVASSDIGAIWVRKAFAELSLQERDAESVDEKIWRTEWNRSLLGLYYALGQHPWVSPLQLAVRAENKLYQWSVARDLGLRFPRTLTSNLKHELEDFCRACNGQLAFKLLHQDIYRHDQQVVGLYTNKIDLSDLEHFVEMGENPITVQEYIDKAYEVRYTVVGNKHFVCRIESQASDSTRIDWRRYDLPKTPHYPMEPPESVKVQVSKLMNTLGLSYGALDFIVTHHNEWYFLEVNSMGQWLWIEDLTGLSITTALADLLCQLNQKFL
jgi:hypothetical protein